MSILKSPNTGLYGNINDTSLKALGYIPHESLLFPTTFDKFFEKKLENDFTICVFLSTKYDDKNVWCVHIFGKSNRGRGNILLFRKKVFTLDEIVKIEQKQAKVKKL